MAEKHVIFAYDLDPDNSDEDALAIFREKYKPFLWNKKEYPITTAVFLANAETSEDAKQEIRAKIKKMGKRNQSRRHKDIIQQIFYCLLYR
jgi:hypothetical protein